MIALQRIRVFATTAAVAGFVSVWSAAGYAADQAPLAALLDQPLPVPTNAEPTQTPSVVQPTSVGRPASVSDAQYAAEKQAAINAPASLATAVPVPGSSGAALAPTVVTSFAGLDRPGSVNNGFVFQPPDTILGKSPNRVIEATNSAIRLSFSGGGIISTRDLNSFFGAPVANGRLFDPKVYYDRNATNRRIYVVALQVSGRGDASISNNISRMWVAVSRSLDPIDLTTSWCRYNIDSRAEVGSANVSWGDFPSVGAGRDSFSMTLNNFRFSNDGFRFSRIHVWNKNIASNNAGSCPSVPRFIFQPSGTAGNFGLFTIQPAQSYISPSSGTNTTNPAYYLSTTRGSSNQYHVHRIRNVASGSPTYTRVSLSGGSYGIPPAGTQPGTAATIDSGDNRMLQVAGMGNNLVGILTTVCNFTSNTPNESCVRVPRILVGFGSGGTLAASIQEQTFAGFGNNIFVHHPSIATDTQLRSGSTWEFNGTGGGGFRLSSAAMFKLVNAGFSGVQTYAPGNCAYLLGRAGDYSGAQLDPSLVGFWLAGERALDFDGPCQWDTRIVRLNP